VTSVSSDYSSGGLLIELNGVGVSFANRTVFFGVDLSLHVGAEVAITGRSGSGKTSLLLVAAGLLAPTCGSVKWPGLSSDMSRRRSEIAMIFQAPSLIPELTALENVCLPLRLTGESLSDSRERGEEALSTFELMASANSLPSELSGGQQQRVAAARAIAGRPRVILADEPTGALNRALAQTMIDELRGAVHVLQTCLVIATHDQGIASQFEKQFDISDGAARNLQ
jgi:ABC-type lipoprotein export system ATPase subunit